MTLRLCAPKSVSALGGTKGEAGAPASAAHAGGRGTGIKLKQTCLALSIRVYHGTIRRILSGGRCAGPTDPAVRLTRDTRDA